MESLCMLGLLGICSWQDLKRKELSLWILGFAGIAGIVVQLLWYRHHSLYDFGGMAVGIVMLLVALLTEQQIGVGDGLMLIVVGIYMGLWVTLAIFLFGLLAGAVAGLALLLFFHKGKHYEMPFVPFLLIGFVIWLALQ